MSWSGMIAPCRTAPLRTDSSLNEEKGELQENNLKYDTTAGTKAVIIMIDE